MKPLVQKLWAVKFIGDDFTKPNFKLSGFHLTKREAETDLDVYYQRRDYKVVRVEVRELKGK